MNWILTHQLYILWGVTMVCLLGFALLFRSMYRLNKKMKRVLGGVAKGDENEAHDTLRRIIEIEGELQQIKPRLDIIETVTATSIQKVGFVRFNPFSGTGGDNSFVLALLDKANDGVLISSLYMREGIRMYGKKVENGKTHYPLLEEEKQVLEETVKK